MTDSTRNQDSKSTVITVGNTAPTLTINTPLNGDFFTFGQNIPFTVTGSDPEDGAIDSEAECARVTVTFVLVHDTHGHAEDSTPAMWDPVANVCRGVLGTDAGDASHGGYLAGGINASFADTPQPGGIPALETTTQHVLQLRRHEVEDAQEMSGVTTTAAEGGRAISSIDPGGVLGRAQQPVRPDQHEQGDHGSLRRRRRGRRRRNAAARGRGPSGRGRAARCWSTITLTAPARPTTTPTRARTAPLNFTGNQRLFLVFRAVPGGPTTGLGNVNWVEFGETGVTP